MSINDQYEIDIESLQSVLGILSPQTSLTITAKSVVLVEYSDGRADSGLVGSKAIAKKLNEACEQFYSEG